MERKKWKEVYQFACYVHRSVLRSAKNMLNFEIEWLVTFSGVRIEIRVKDEIEKIRIKNKL